MQRTAFLTFVVASMISLAGCGGQLGHDSPVQVRLETSTNTVNFANIHVIISPNNGSAVSGNAASDIQAQAWVTTVLSASFKELDFTTSSQQIPYFGYVQNTSGVQEQARLRIFMDGVEKFNQVVTIPATTAAQETTIFRNNLQ